MKSIYRWGWSSETEACSSRSTSEEDLKESLGETDWIQGRCKNLWLLYRNQWLAAAAVSKWGGSINPPETWMHLQLIIPLRQFEGWTPIKKGKTLSIPIRSPQLSWSGLHLGWAYTPPPPMIHVHLFFHFAYTRDLYNVCNTRWQYNVRLAALFYLQTNKIGSAFIPPGT